MLLVSKTRFSILLFSLSKWYWGAPLVQRVITQTRMRVLEGNKVASEQKVLTSLSHIPAPSHATKVARWSSLAARSCSMKWRAAS